METNNFIGSFADENVSFKTRIVKTNTLGDNYWKVLIFVESDRFVDATATGWEAIPGSATCKALSVGATDYAEHTTGLLRSWLFDLFANGFTGNCILVALGDKTKTAAEQTELLTEAYGLMKMFAYHKTVCMIEPSYEGADADATALNINTTACVDLVKLCVVDKEFISSAPYFPYATQTPETPSSDLIYAALTAANVTYAFMSCYADATRNAALYSLGLALSQLNNSGTPVGNSFDMWQSDSIGSSGPGGTGLPKAVRRDLNTLYIQTWKPVGDNTALVAAEGAETLGGETIAANWCVAYITYMSKVGIARLMTTPNFFRNADNYSKIIGVLAQFLGKIGDSQRISAALTVPAFDKLPKSSSEIIVNDAWEGVYKDVIRQVAITGRLYIGTAA